VGREPLTPPAILRDVEAPWMLCSLDRWFPGERVVELKTVFGPPSDEWGEEGTDQVPEAYLLQTTWQMGVAGLNRADIATLFCGYTFAVYTVQFDEQLFKLLTAIAADFWDRVSLARVMLGRVPHTPPPLDWSHPLAPEALARVQRVTPGKAVTLGEDAAYLAQMHLESKRIAKEATAQADDLKRQLTAMMGDAERAELPDGFTVKRGLVRREGYTVEPTSYETFRIIHPRRHQEIEE
jgi:predicted phage-related endonuclease